MSDNIETPFVPPPLEEPSVEQKAQWLKDWSVRVEKEIHDYTTEKDKLYTHYKKQKDMYDRWLGIKMKKIKKYDVVVNNRKKVLIDIRREINTLSGAPQDIPSVVTGSMET